MHRPRALAVNLAVAATSLALCFGVLEVAARLARSRQKGGKEQRTRTLYTEHDPLLGWRKTPGARALYERREYTIELAVNGQGLRDRDRAYAPAEGTFRILALGDSFVEAFQVPLDDAVTRVLERSLSGPRCAVDVVNGGTVGYSTDQEYLFYKEEGHKYAPQVVLLFFYYNDVLYNDRADNLGIPKPRLTFRADAVKVANEPVPRRPPVKVGEAPADGPVRRGSAALDWLGERLERSQPQAYESLARLGLWRPLRRMSPAGELFVFMRRPPRVIEEAWDETERILRALARETLRHGARLVVVYVPCRMEVQDRDWELTKLRYGLREKAWDRGAVLARLRTLAQAQGLPVVDPTAALKGAVGVFSQPYYEHDSHWNALGHRVVAAEVAAFLGRKAWVPDCGRP